MSCRAQIEAEELAAAAHRLAARVQVLQDSGYSREAMVAATLSTACQQAAANLRARALRCSNCGQTKPDSNCPVCGRFYKHGKR